MFFIVCNNRRGNEGMAGPSLAINYKASRHRRGKWRIGKQITRVLLTSSCVRETPVGALTYLSGGSRAASNIDGTTTHTHASFHFDTHTRTVDSMARRGNGAAQRSTEVESSQAPQNQNVWGDFFSKYNLLLLPFLLGVTNNRLVICAHMCIYMHT